MHELSARRQLIFAALLGAATVLGFAPFYVYPIPVATIACLFLLWQRCTTAKQAAWLGLAFGLGFFNTGIYWIYISLHDFGGMPWWMATLATFALNAFLALFPAMVGWLSKRNRYLLATAPLLWVFSEWVRSWIFTGFPWLAVGYSQVPYSPLAGFAPVFGIYGVSLIVVAASSAIVFWSKARLRLVLFLLTLWVAGSLLKHVEWSEPYHEPISVALLQGNIAQDMKWLPETTRQTLDQYLTMALDSQARLIVMPETALPVLVQQLPAQYIEQLRQHALQQHGDILLGVVEKENDDHYYNSMLSIGSAATQVYRKSHLVPFGEFIPLKSIFGWIYRDWLNIPLTDLSRGDTQQKPLNLAGQQIAINICYEDVFGEEVIRQLPQATLLVNASNDAWYGNSLAADQHMQMSQARAMETARMVIRSTNTGATVVINRDGRVLAALPHFTTSALTAQVQGYTGTTPYIGWGNWPVICFILLSLGILWSRKRTQD